MAQHASALKQMRQSLKHRARNRKNLSQVKTQVKKLRAAIAKGDADEAKKSLGETVGEIDRAAKKGVIHDNAAAGTRAGSPARSTRWRDRGPSRLPRAGLGYRRGQRRARFPSRLHPPVRAVQRDEGLAQVALRPAP